MEKEKGKQSFVFYFKWFKVLRKMTSKNQGLLMIAIADYFEKGEFPGEDNPIYSIFSMMECQFEEDLEKWKNTCNKNRDNVLQRYKKQG